MSALRLCQLCENGSPPYSLHSRLQVLLQPHISRASSLPFLSEAMQMDVERLYDACLQVVAAELRQLVSEPLLANLIRLSAGSVGARQDVDSVPLVDDLRYHITQGYGDEELSGEHARWLAL